MKNQPFHGFARRSHGQRRAARPLTAARPEVGPDHRGARVRGATGALTLALALTLGGLAGCGEEKPDGDVPAELMSDRFDANAAFDLISRQVAIGQRPAGSPELRKAAEELRPQLPGGRFEPVPGGLRNIVGALPGRDPAIVIGAHYDTEAHPEGFVGANDSAAGTAAVIELARTLEAELPAHHREVRFVLFDGEEEPVGCPATEFASCGLRGSRAYAERHKLEVAQGRIGEFILLDYVANEGLQIPREANSDEALWGRLRDAASEVGAATVFPAGEQGGIIDDTYPFLLAGVPSIDLIDFSYEYRDTVEDTPDKLDVRSLDAVGESVAELVLRLSAE